jgi:hypothetical protein
MNHLDHYAGPEPSGLINEILERRSGQSPNGFPIFRVVRSEFVMHKTAGAWHEWDDDLSYEDRGGMKVDREGAVRGSDHKADRIIVEMRETPAYTHLDEQGWILEQWFPAEYFGSREAWENNVVRGTNLPTLGPYPDQGAYLFVTGPFTEAEPDITFLIDFISFRETKRDSYPEDVEKFVRMRVLAEEKRQADRDAAAHKTNVRRLMDSTKGLTSNTLEAGRWRQRQFEKAGFTSHLGN